MNKLFKILRNPIAAFTEWSAKREPEIAERNNAIYNSLPGFDGNADIATLAVRIDDARARNTRRRPF